MKMTCGWLATVAVSLFTLVTAADSSTDQAAVPDAGWGVHPPECNFVLEYMHLQDFSHSFLNDIVALQVQLPQLISGINSTYPGSRYGLATFVDKPLQPFGFGYQGPWFTGDWCYNVTAEIGTEDPANIVDDMLACPLGGGADWAENQLGALHDIALNDTLSGWTNRTHDDYGYPIVRVISLSTDAIYHVAPQGANSVWNLIPNDGDGYTDCDGEDYPTRDQVKHALESRGIYTIFLAGNTTDEDVVGVYQELLDVIGTGGGAYAINADSSDILSAMEVALETFNNKTCVTPTIDIVFCHDVTSSYANDVVHLKPRLDALTAELSLEYISPQFGLTTFGDKPLVPFGFLGSGDYCYQCEQVLTYDRTEVLDAANDVKMTSGFDWRESQLDGLISSVVDPTIGWRTGSTWNGFSLYRIVVLATDAGFHRFPHAANAGYSLAPHSGGMVNCTGEEYPTWQQAAEALLLKDVHPLFVPTSDIASIYHNLLADMKNTYGIIGEVVELVDFGDAADVAAAISDGVRRLEAKLRTIGGSRMLANMASGEIDL